MGKARGSIQYKPDKDNPDELALQAYLRNSKDGISVTILDAAMMLHGAIATLESGNPDPSKAMNSILDLSREIDRIYTAYVVAGINLPTISRIYGFVTVSTIDPPTSTPPQSSDARQKHVVLDDEDDDDSWDEIPRRLVMPEPEYDLDSYRYH